MTSISDAPLQPGDEDRRWAEASGRVRHHLEHGRQVRGPSTQLLLLVLVIIASGLTLIARVGEPVTAVVIWQLLLRAAATAMSGFGYVSSRRSGRLMPQFPVPRDQRVLAPLLPAERRDLARQIRGRAAPTDQSRQLIRDLIANATRQNRSTLPSLTGMLLFMFSTTLYLGWPWPLLVVATVVFLLIVTAFEARRWKKVLEGTSLHPGSET